MMLALKIPESSPTIGPFGGKAPIAKASLVQVLSLSSEGDDHDIGYDPTPHNANKFSRMTDEKMQVAVPETELSSRETATTKDIFSFSSMDSLSRHINIILTPAWITFCRGYGYR